MNQSTINPEEAPYQLKCADWPGLGKVIEESGELGQVFGKIISCGGQTVNPWGFASLSDKMVEESADLLAALTFMINNGPHIDKEAVYIRADRKYKLFGEWAAGRTDAKFEEIAL